ncbi:hypothetical protein THAOC_22907 [Thalassiosira oceanica]|uniref:Uncharacterized protein n=1 Tax=Thalassiosira oceanica TaxID=159749 RepID=K0SEP7_THAOC|nr:hypothetical protein THAOC_22907 [Thalassiosira oceanica]|eukprot:EJK57087.1 hypothetical protein THAOC_22907 [Thalassiosira oceanica]
MAGRLLMGQIPSERYAILGRNIAYSVSPQMQGGGVRGGQAPAHVRTGGRRDGAGVRGRSDMERRQLRWVLGDDPAQAVDHGPRRRPNRRR